MIGANQIPIELQDERKLETAIIYYHKNAELCKYFVLISILSLVVIIYLHYVYQFSLILVIFFALLTAAGSFMARRLRFIHVCLVYCQAKIDDEGLNIQSTSLNKLNEEDVFHEAIFALRRV